MDSELILVILSDFVVEQEQLAVSRKLGEILTHHTLYMKNRNGPYRGEFKKGLAEIDDVLKNSITNNYMASMISVSERLDLYDYTGLRLLASIEARVERFNSNDLRRDLQELKALLDKKLSLSKSTLNGLRGFNITEPSFRKGEVPLNLIIPSEYKNGDYKSFLDANSTMLSVIDTMNQVSGVGTETTKILSTRRGSFLMELSIDPATVKTILDMVAAILSALAASASYALMQKNLETTGVSQEIITEIMEKLDGEKDKKIDDLKQKLSEAYEENSTQNITNNFSISINNSVNTMVKFYEEGVRVEAIVDESESDSNNAISEIKKLNSEIRKLSQNKDVTKYLQHDGSLGE